MASTVQQRADWARRRQALAARLSDELRRYKVDQGCYDCGYNAHHAGLDFDHRPGEIKVATVAVLAGKGKITKTWEEVKKCDVVCKTCHGIRTWNRIRVVER